MDSDDFYTVARQLARGRSVAELRAAVSRYYFGLYNAAFSFVQRLPPRQGELRGDSDDHKAVRGLLSKVGARDVAGALQTLRLARNKADYENEYPGDEDFRRFAAPAIEEAESGLKALRAVSLDEARARYEQINMAGPR